jgi:hypothetical protein
MPALPYGSRPGLLQVLRDRMHVPVAEREREGGRERGRRGGRKHSCEGRREGGREGGREGAFL